MGLGSSICRYSVFCQSQGTVGIYRNIELVSTPSAVISFVVPQIFLTKDQNWDVQVAAYLQCKEGAEGEVTATLETGVAASGLLHCHRDGEERVDLRFTVPGDSVKRWFPVGYGEHPLYKLTVAFEDSEKTVSVGFRTADLIREKIGDDEESMFFRVNDIDVFARGSNFIPMDVFESRISDEDIAVLLDAAVKGNQNVIRVWGGGLYQRDSFYDIADRLGLLVTLTSWREG